MTKRLNFALFGSGRIGKIHAQTIANNQQAELKAICDPFNPEIESLANSYRAKVLSEEDIFASSEIDAILIASPSNTHCALIAKAGECGKHAFCEKPIDLDIAKVRGLVNSLESSNLKFGVGLQRRHDPSFAYVGNQLQYGKAGTIENITLISRDPAPAPIEYLKTSGGVIRDMTIHDIDVMCFLLGEDKPVQVFAQTSNFVDPEISNINDYSGVSIQYKTQNGVLVQIINSRRSSYGYDQRVEVFCSEATFNIGNKPTNLVSTSNDKSIEYSLPKHFFLERYFAAYTQELEAFIAAIQNDTEFHASLKDGLQALEIAEHTIASINSGLVVKFDGRDVL